MVAARENFPLLEELLAEQQRLDTPVARFSAAHDAGAATLRPQLIPLTAPGPGERYAFEVDLDACSGCKACVAACHALNGLDETETWRDAGLLVGGDERHPFQQTVTTACHHCADPACLNGCPVLAYEQDPATGIVRHLDDQCIGCQYCILKCPYDAPKYNARLGIVRKCDLCHGRLAAGEAPACAQACPTQAIRVVIVAAAEAGSPGETGERAPSEPEAALPDFFSAVADPAYTRPATRYRSRRAQPENLHAADAAVLRPQPPHWPLAIMLTLLPLAVGAEGVAAIRVLAHAPAENVTREVVRLAWAAGIAGLAASVAHLGRPLRAWRIFLGWRRSWLSREAIAFAAWAAAATATLRWPALAVVAAAAGAAGLWCSAMIYVDTRRAMWRCGQTATRFFGAATALGAAVGLAFGAGLGASAIAAGGATLLKLGCDGRLLRGLDLAAEDELPDARGRTARILRGPLWRIFGLRLAAAAMFGLLTVLVVTGGAAAEGWMALAVALAGELLERHLFFRAVDAPKMPGGPA